MLMKSTEPDFNFIKIVNEAKEKRQSQAGSHCRLGSGVDPEASRSEGNERSVCARGASPGRAQNIGTTALSCPWKIHMDLFRRQMDIKIQFSGEKFRLKS